MDGNKFAGVVCQWDILDKKASAESYVVECINVIVPEKTLLTRRAVVEVFKSLVSPDFNQSAFRQMQLRGDAPPTSCIVKRRLYPVRDLARWLIEKGYCEPTRTH